MGRITLPTRHGLLLQLLLDNGISARSTRLTRAPEKWYGDPGSPSLGGIGMNAVCETTWARMIFGLFLIASVAAVSAGDSRRWGSA